MTSSNKFLFFAGLDPGLDHIPFVEIDADEQVVNYFIARTPKDKGQSAANTAASMTAAAINGLPTLHHTLFAVEGQMAYRARPGMRHADPNSLIRIATVSGAAIAAGTSKGAVTLLPLPKDWNTVPKHVNQARICTRMGWPYAKAGSGTGQYCHPVDLSVLGEKISKSSWKHLLDALGLALWAKDQAKNQLV